MIVMPSPTVFVLVPLPMVWVIVWVVVRMMNVIVMMMMFFLPGPLSIVEWLLLIAGFSAWRMHLLLPHYLIRSHLLL